MQEFNPQKNNRPAQKLRFLSAIRSLKLLPRVLTDADKKTVRIASLIGGVAFVVFLVMAYLNATTPVAADGGTYHEGVVGQPKYINPLYSQANDVDTDLARLVYSGLMRYDRTNTLVADLAESYEISEDQRNYIFHLRKNVTWQDGEPFSADDVIFTVQAIKNAEWASPLATNFQEVAVEKVDDSTVKFTLVKNSYTPFLRENTTFGILPKHIWENIVPAQALLSEYNLKPIGTGPYKLKEYHKDKKSGIIQDYVLERNTQYYLGKPHINEITLSFYNDTTELVSALSKKQVEGISQLPPQDKAKIKAKAATAYTLKLPRYFALFFNMDRNDMLKDKNVRQAMAYALDRDRIIRDALMGDGEKSYGPIPKNFRGYHPDIKKYELNVDQANKMLDDAKWTDKDADGIRWKNNRKLEATVVIPNKDEFQVMATILQENLRAIGMSLNVQAYDAAELQSQYIKPRNYEILLFGEVFGHDPDPYPFWHSIQRTDPGLNLSSFKSTEIDDLLETARRTKDEEARVKKYLNFQNIIAEELPAIFLYSSTYTYAVNPKIKGVTLEYITLPSDRFAEVHEWYIKTKRAWKK